MSGGDRRPEQGTRPGSGHPRPRQVTVSAGVAAAGCALLVLSLFDYLTRIRSLEQRESLAPFARALGVSVGGVIDFFRVLVFLSAALAAAGVVLAVYAFQRHRGARLGLGVVAGLLVPIGIWVGGLLPLLVAAAAAGLWGRDARDWFAGLPPRPRPEPVPPGSSGAPSGPPSGPPSAAPPPAAYGAPPASGDRPGPAPYAYGSGTPVQQPLQRPGPPLPPSEVWQRPGAAPAPRPAGPQPGRPPVQQPGRPGAVTAAAWLTWVFGSLALLFFVFVVITLLADRQQLLAAFEGNERIVAAGLTDRDIVSTVWVIAAVGISWSLGALALAVLAYRRVGIARTVLVVSAFLSGLVALFAVGIGWPHAVAALVAGGLLLGRRSQDWFAGRDGAPPQPPYQPPSQPPSEPPVW